MRAGVAYALLPDADVSAAADMDMDLACDPAGACAPATAATAPACPAGWAPCAVALVTVRTSSFRCCRGPHHLRFVQRLVVGYTYTSDRAGLTATRARLVCTCPGSTGAQVGDCVLPPEPLTPMGGFYARPLSPATPSAPAPPPLLSAAAAVVMRGWLAIGVGFLAAAWKY